METSELGGQTLRTPVTLDLLEMVSLIIWLSFLPEGPDDMQPTISQAAISVAVGEATALGTLKVAGSPHRIGHRADGELLGRLPIGTVAGAAKDYPMRLSALPGDRAGAGDGGQDGAARVAVAMVTEHDQELGCEELTSTWQRVKDEGVFVLAKQVGDQAQRLSLLSEKGGELAGQMDRARLRGSGNGQLGLRSSSRELSILPGQRVAMIVAVALEKGDKLLIAECLQSLGRRKSLEKGQGDVGLQVKRRQGLGVITQQIGPQPIVLTDDRAGQVVDPAEMDTHLADESAVRTPGNEPVAVGTQQVGHHIGVVVVVFGACLR